MYCQGPNCIHHYNVKMFSNFCLFFVKPVTIYRRPSLYSNHILLLTYSLFNTNKRSIFNMLTDMDFFIPNTTHVYLHTRACKVPLRCRCTLATIQPNEDYIPTCNVKKFNVFINYMMFWMVSDFCIFVHNISAFGDLGIICAYRPKKSTMYEEIRKL